MSGAPEMHGRRWAAAHAKRPSQTFRALRGAAASRLRGVPVYGLIVIAPVQYSFGWRTTGDDACADSTQTKLS